MSRMTWIRLELPDHLHRRLKAQAVLGGKTLKVLLTEVIEKAVEELEKETNK